MKRKKIPTIIGILLLIISLATGVFLVQSRQIFRIGASAEASPKNVRISNISSDSFSVSWTTDTKSIGFIKYGESQNNIESTQQEENSIAHYVHLSKLSGLKANTQYYFKINSGGNDFDNNGVVWQTKTGPELTLPTQTNLISGSVLTASGTPSKNSLVYVTIGSTLLSTMTSQNGSWVIPLSSARSADGQTLLSIGPSTTMLEISVQAGPDGITSAQIYPQSANPVPAMLLGQTYDFKNNAPNQSSDLPNANIQAPEEATASSGFNLPTKTASPSGTKTVVLESIDEGETVTTTKPELVGEAPAGTKIQILIESENPQTGTVTVPSSGDWNWEVPKDLPVGPHKITITWKDSTGITRTLIRNFVVSASEGPAFVATPSATPKQTVTPKPTATAKATASATPKATLKATSSATPFPQPESGSLTPTLLLSIMGIGIISFAFLIWKKSEI